MENRLAKYCPVHVQEINVILDVKKVIWLVKTIDNRREKVIGIPPKIKTIECDNKNINFVPGEQGGITNSAGEHQDKFTDVQ